MCCLILSLEKKQGSAIYIFLILSLFFHRTAIVGSKMLKLILEYFQKIQFLGLKYDLQFTWFFLFFLSEVLESKQWLSFRDTTGTQSDKKLT